MRRLAAACLLASLAPAAATAAEPEDRAPRPSTFELRPPPGPVPFGAPVEIEGAARFQEGLELSIDLATQTTGPVAVVKATLGKPATEAAMTTVPVRLSIVPFEVGAVTLPSLAWTLRSASGSSDTLRSPPVRLEALAPAGSGEPSEIRDIKPPLRPPLWRFWPILLLLAAAGAAAAWAWRRWRGRPGAAGGPRAEADRRLPHERALDELKALAGLGLPPKEFYDRLSEILRAYLEGRFGIVAMVMTTPDVLRQMRQAELDRAVLARSKDLFEACDLVKFARVIPDREELLRDWDSAVRIVRDTEPKPLEPAPAP